MTEKRVQRLSRKLGAIPGELIPVGLERDHTVKVTVIDYDATGHCADWEPANLEEVVPLKETKTVSWINVDGIHEVPVIERLGQLFGVHALILEDILHSGQRPKIEDLGNCLYIVLKMLTPGEGKSGVEWEQLSMLVGENFLLTFQEKPGGDFFDPVRQRIRQDKGRIRKCGADYLAHALIDVIVDNYFVVLEGIGDKIEALEDEIMEHPAPDSLQKINHLKRGTLALRRAAWPLREVIANLQRSESPLVRADTRPYLKDVYDHCIQIMDTVETFRDILGGMVEIYMSSLSNRMNEVMKVLTIITTVFIPLTFVVGVYGMNFEHMPELKWEYGYALVLIVMLVLAYGMVLYFRRKKWIE
ncbi:MAG: magnesium/cobalt transporter CorA [Gemmatimonadetes bacterium]|nr:magnesium/cobalt transporter CorA [Gemmatimonadota bacterium]